MNEATVKYLSALHTTLYRVTGGIIGRRLVSNDMCLLTTFGRNTGRRHTVPLLYLEDGTGVIVIASYGGRKDHPEWYRNLVAHPEAQLQILRTRSPVLARTASTDERAECWPRIVEAYHDYAVYQSRTDREIPVVFLEPRNQVETP